MPDKQLFKISEAIGNVSARVATLESDAKELFEDISSVKAELTKLRSTIESFRPILYIMALAALGGNPMLEKLVLKLIGL